MHGLLIVSGIESVEAAIDSAVDMHRYYASISKRASLFSLTLLTSEKSDTIIYDSNGQVYFSTAHSLPNEISLLLNQKVSHVIAHGNMKIIRHCSDCILSIKGRLLQSGGRTTACTLSLVFQAQTSWIST